MRTVTIGDCTLIHGDALAVLPTIEAGSVDALISDPPYSSGGMFRGDRQKDTRTKYQQSDVMVEHPTFSGDNRDQRAWAHWMALWLSSAADACKPGAMTCLFTDWRQLPSCTDSLQAGGWLWMGIVPWDKMNARPMPNRFRQQAEFVVWGTNGPRDFSLVDAVYHPGIFRVGAPPTADRVHSTQKPVELMTELVCVAGECSTVLDPFMGSGTTGVACIKTNRRFIGIEKDAGYFDIACRRIQAAYDETALFNDSPQSATVPLMGPQGIAPVARGARDV